MKKSASLRSDQVADLLWNRWPQWSGTGGRNPPELVAVLSGICNHLFLEMKSRVEDIIEPFADGVKYFPLCEKCAGTVEIIGQGIFIDPDEEFYVL